MINRKHIGHYVRVRTVYNTYKRFYCRHGHVASATTVSSSSQEKWLMNVYDHDISLGDNHNTHSLVGTWEEVCLLAQAAATTKSKKKHELHKNTSKQ